ncbi:amidase [Pseudonocardia dioxanivorans] [Mycobacterium shimoidei]|uniref:Amidase [Pseudonocardia dioxanivorans] n=1 Tax=Mycobacterium shimoidei TaxID=29313 RepID=A0A375YZW7_MYCSH|nr:amidase [Mycobacterium shimoidei]SRX94377.1 amidase [Pseudonocardia dioxanivorans] [Mycobacterium shimoidei]
MSSGCGDFPNTLTETAAALRSGAVTSVALTEAVIARAEKLDSMIGVYLARFDDYAMAAAATADAELAAGVDRGPLHGIPCGVKDVLAMAEGPTTAQSLILDSAWGAGCDAPVVARLKRAGAVITGKTSAMEFGIGLTDADKPFPIPRNPWDTMAWPGGSSSGSGAGVAAGLFYAAIGTDTLGSIRIPAGFCGVSGLMPTFGRVPKSGCVPLGYSLDHVGPLARSAEDCAAVLEVIAGHHPSDPDCVDAPFAAAASLTGDLAGVRVGVVTEQQITAEADPALLPSLEAAVAVLAEQGADVRDVRLPYSAEAVTGSIVTVLAEALAYHRDDLARRWEDYSDMTRAMIVQGALVSGADYVQAQRVRRVTQHALAELFTEVDLIVCPTLKVGAPSYDLLKSHCQDISWLAGLVNTVYWDFVGNPVLAVPMGFTSGGMPLSMQIAARPFDEATALRAGQVYQKHTSWHLQWPAICCG